MSGSNYQIVRVPDGKVVSKNLSKERAEELAKNRNAISNIKVKVVRG